jgi:PAS domain S-box-containing protein
MTAPHEARCAAERRLEAFVATSDEVVWELDRDGLMTYVSATVGRHLGYEPIELIGQGWQAIMPSSEHQRGRVIIERAVAGGRGWDDEEFVFTTKAGHLRPMWSSGLALRNDQAAVLGVAGTLRPVRAGDHAAADERSRQRIQDIIAWRLFEPVFQPIVALADGSTYGVEALSRFPFHPRRTPAQIFADATALGQASELELAAIETALSAAHTLPGHLRISLNISPPTLLSPQLPELITRSGYEPRRLILEITEQVPVTEYAPIVAALANLRQRGCLLAVDDAGAGYASFKHILTLAPDLIKLDRFLVTGVDADPARRALIRSVVSFAAEVGAQIIGEGIETAAEQATLRRLGVPYGQGYHLGPPLPLTSSTDPISRGAGLR